MYVSVSSNFGGQNYLMQVTFVTFLLVSRHFWQYVVFKDRYSKKPESVTRKDKIFINSSIAAHDSATQDLAARIHQKRQLLDQK